MADMTDVILAMALSDGGGGGGSVTGVVRYSVEQNLTDAQKQTAKSNIGAAGETALASVYDPNDTQTATGTTVFVPGQHFMYKGELYMAVENIEQGDEIEPGENAIVISVDELVLEKADNATFRDAIANQFSDSVDYKKGDYVWYNGVLCLFDRDHAAGEWDDDDVVTDAPITNYARDAGAVRYDEAQALTDAQKTQARANIGVDAGGGSTDGLVRYDAAQILTDAQKAQARENIEALTGDDFDPVFAANLSTSETSRGITFAWSGSKCHVSGNTTGSSSGTGNSTFYNQSSTLPVEIWPGGTYAIHFKSDHVTLKIWPYVSGSLGSKIYDSKGSGTATFPAGTTGLFCRLDADWGVEINEIIEPLILTMIGNRILDIEEEQDRHKATVCNAFHQYAFLDCEYIDGYYNASGQIVGTGSTWKTYLVPITNNDRYWFYNRNISLAVLDGSKNFIAIVDNFTVRNAIQGLSANVEALCIDISGYPAAKYVAIPRNSTNLTYLRSAQLPDVVPMFPFNSDSTCENLEISTANMSADCNAEYKALRFVASGFMSITTGEMWTGSSNYVSSFVMLKKGTTLSTKNTPYRIHLRGQNANGAVYVGATDEYTLPWDFWGTVDYSSDSTWAWSDFAPQNLTLKEAQFFVTMITPEDLAANPWLGKTWYSYGTSISDIGANDAAGNNGHSGKFPLYLDQVSGMTRHNGAIGSGGIRTSASHGGNVLQALLTTPFDVDLVTLETLPNDGVDDPANVGDITDTGTTTICGAFKTAVEYIITSTRAKFVLIFVGGYAAGASAMNSTHMAYIAAKDKLKQIAECYGIPVIDAEKDAADWVHRKSGILLADNIHPNYLGGYVYGRYIWEKLLEINPNPVYQQTT